PVELRAPEQVSKILGLAPREGRQLTALGELLLRIGARRFKKAIGHRCAAKIRGHQRFRYQVGDAVGDVRRWDVVACCNCAGRFQREASGKYGEPAQHCALRFRQQVVAPVERRAERLVAWQRRAAASRQEAKPVVEARSEALYDEDIDAAGREFDRKRNSIKPAADVGDDGGVGVAQLEFVRDGGGPLDEKLDRRKSHGLVRREPGGRGGNRPRPGAVDPVPLPPSRLAGGCSYSPPAGGGRSSPVT